VRQILLEKGSYIKKKKYSKHRQWREPSEREGQMVRFDTSDHDWHEFCVLRLEGRGPRPYLIGGVDDATSKVAGAKFVLTDGAKENMEVFKSMVQRRGIPLSVYVDVALTLRPPATKVWSTNLKENILPPNLPELWRN